MPSISHCSPGLVARKLGQSLHVKLPSQDELLAAVQHTPVEDATQPAGAGATE